MQIRSLNNQVIKYLSGVLTLLMFMAQYTSSHAQAESRAHSRSTAVEDLYRHCPEARFPDQKAGHTFSLSQGKQQVSNTASLIKDQPAKLVRRIGVWGDSHTASGDFIYAALNQWGIPKRDIRPSLIQPAFQMPGVRLPLRKLCLSSGWATVHAQRGFQQGGLFNQTLLQIRSETSNDFMWIDFRFPHENVRLDQLRVHFVKEDPDRVLVMGVTVDNQQEKYFSTTPDLPSTLEINASHPFATIRIRLIVGELIVQALEPVYSNPPATLVDIFSSPGAVAKVWSDFKPVILGKPYETVIFEYGTNEAMASDFNEAEYTNALRKSLSNFRALHPKAHCILIGPPERGGVSNRPPTPYTVIHKIINQVQIKVAKEQGCKAWNWQASLQTMGTLKQLSVYTLPILGADMVHLTKEGYEISGQMFGKMISWKN